MKTKAIIFFFTLIVTYSAQQIYISKGYTSSGEPIDLIYNQKTELDQSLCIILNNGKANFTHNFIFFYVDQVSKSLRKNILSKMIRPDKESNWMLEKFKFVNEGDYEIYFTNFNRERIADAKLTVTKKKINKVVEKPDPEYLPNMRVLFARRIQSGRPINLVDNVSLSRDGGEIYFYIINDKPLNTSKLEIKINRKEKTADYDKYIDTKKFQIDPSWTDTYFKYVFMNKGEYKISIFNEKELLIKTAYISVEN